MKLAYRKGQAKKSPHYEGWMKLGGRLVLTDRSHAHHVKPDPDRYLLLLDPP